MINPAASGPEETPGGPKEKAQELDPTTEKTARIAEHKFAKVKDQSLHILSVFEQYNFSAEIKTAFRDLLKCLSGPGDLTEFNKFNQISNKAKKKLSDELVRLGRGNLKDFEPVGSDFQKAKFLKSTELWENDINELRGILRSKIESEISAIPNFNLQFKLISPRDAKHIQIQRKAMAEEREISKEEEISLSEHSEMLDKPFISSECIRMDTTCEVSPNDSQFCPNDYIVELETASFTKYKEIFGDPSGHNPHPRPQSLILGVVDTVMTTLTLLDQVPKVQDNETVYSFSFPTLIIRPKKEGKSLISLPTVHNTYPSQMNAVIHGVSDDLGAECEGCKIGNHNEDSNRPYECSNLQSQYIDIKAQCNDSHATIVGKCEIIQRVVRRGEDLVFEKGIRGGKMTELMKVPLKSLFKQRPNS